jgi:hypothetical protein
MKISIFNQYGALNSKPVFEAFITGSKKLGHDIVYHELSADVIVIWSVLWYGRMSQNKIIWETAKKHKIPIIVLEVGCLNRGVTWRVGLNGINNLPPYSKNRSNILGIELKPWKNNGSNILICGQRLSSHQWIHNSEREWLTTVVNNIRKYSDRKIIFRPHPREKLVDNYSDLGIIIDIPTRIIGTYDDFNFESSMNDAWIVVNSCSNTGILSVINGIPVVTDEHSIAYDMSTVLDNIENPCYPDRERWLEQLCHTEFTIDEISNCIGLKEIFDQIQ